MPEANLDPAEGPEEAVSQNVGDEPEEEIQTGAAWHALERIAQEEGKPNSLLDITDLLSDLASYAKNELDYVEGIVRHGADPKMGSLDVHLSPTELQALALGLNLTGFFSERHGVIAEALLDRIVVAREEQILNFTDEEKAQLADAQQALRNERMAEMFGFESVEDFQNAVDESVSQAQAQGDELD